MIQINNKTKEGVNMEFKTSQKCDLCNSKKGPLQLVHHKKLKSLEYLLVCNKCVSELVYRAMLDKYADMTKEANPCT